jgi:serine/threonine protein kinase
MGSLVDSDRSGETPLPSLREKLMQARRERDPHRYYEVIKVLGDGSMGSVTKVRKRKHVLGGSARAEYVKQEKRDKCCFGCFSILPFPSNASLFEDSKDSPELLQPVSEDSTEQNSILESSNSNPSKSNKKTYRKSGSGISTSSMITYGQKEMTYALKSIHLDRVKDDTYKEEMINEISILQKLDHPNIVKAMETFDFRNRLYLVLQLCSGGDLYARDPYTEEQACKIISSIIDAVAYMHTKGIVHRDLKFENIMFANPSSNEVKIIDFGLSKKYAHEEHLHDAVGTVYTMAPEVLRGDYDSKVDVWSCGVIVYMLLSSSLPFYGKTRQHVVRRIVAGKYSFKARRWRSISSDAKKFVVTLLEANAKKRPSAVEALRMPWIRKTAGCGSAVDVTALDKVQATIQTFAEYGTLKKLALLVIAYKSTDEEVGFLRKVFGDFDSLHDGEIELDEFKQALKDYHYTEQELERMFSALDIDKTGSIHYCEFLAATIEAHGSIDEQRIAEAFDRLDSDDTGYISLQDLKDFLGDNLSEAYLKEILDEVDSDHDHQISYDEFLGLWDAKEDMKLKKNFLSVNRRRTASLQSLSSDVDSVCSDMDQSTMSANSSELGGGNYFFTVEKEKSVRGVWL